MKRFATERKKFHIPEPKPTQQTVNIQIPTQAAMMIPIPADMMIQTPEPTNRSITQHLQSPET